MAVHAIPNKPGEFFIDELGKSIKLTDVRQDDFYDTVHIAAAVITPGTEFRPFDVIGGKGKQLCNISTARRIPGRHKFNLMRVGIMVRNTTGAAVAGALDTIHVYDAVALKFALNTRLVTEGPLLRYQSGYGIAGSVAQPTVAAVEIPVLTLGVPSAAAAPTFMAAQPVNEDDDLDVTLTFHDNRLSGVSSMPTTVAAVQVTTFLHGIIEKPATI